MTAPHWQTSSCPSMIQGSSAAHWGLRLEVMCWRITHPKIVQLLNVSPQGWAWHGRLGLPPHATFKFFTQLYFCPRDKFQYPSSSSLTKIHQYCHAGVDYHEAQQRRKGAGKLYVICKISRCSRLFLRLCAHIGLHCLVLWATIEVMMKNHFKSFSNQAIFRMISYLIFFSQIIAGYSVFNAIQFSSTSWSSCFKAMFHQDYVVQLFPQGNKLKSIVQCVTEQWAPV